MSIVRKKTKKDGEKLRQKPMKHGGQEGFVPITKLRPGQKAVVASVRGNRRVVQRLADLGLTPKASVDVLKSAPFNGPVEVCLRGSKLAVGREIAENILVRVEET